MMQEHPFFSSPQIFYGNLKGEDDEECEEIIWPISLGKMQERTNDVPGLIFFWCDAPSETTDEIHFS